MTRHLTESQRKTCEWSHVGIAFLVVLSFGTAIAWIVLGSLVAKPALLTANFEEATCKVTEWRFLTYRDCVCAGLTSDDPYCNSKFPCLQVIVEHEAWLPGAMNFTAYNTTDQNQMSNRAILHDSEAELLSVNDECSFHHCSRYERINKIKIEDWKRKHGELGSYFQCYYNPSDTKQVILRSQYKIRDAIFALAIPGGVLILAVFFLTLLCCVVKKEAKKQRREEKKNKKTPQPRPYLQTYDMNAYQSDSEVEPKQKKNGRKSNPEEDKEADLGYPKD